MIKKNAGRFVKLISSLISALALYSCSNFQEGDFLKKYGDIASVQSVSFSRMAIRGGDGWYNVDSSGDLTISYQIDNPGNVDLEASLSVAGVADLVAAGITYTVDSKTSVTVTYPAPYLSSADMDAGGTGDISPKLFLTRTSDNYAQSYDTQRVKCNAPPPAFTNALSQLYSDAAVDPPINERLALCFSLPTLPQDVYLLRVVDKRSGTVHSYDVSGGTIADQSSNGWDLTSTVPGTLEPTYDDGPSFTPSGTAYYIATDVQNLKSRTPFDIELSLHDRGGLSSAATVSSHARKLAAPTCNVSSGFETNTFAQPYIDFIIYAPSNCADATLHFAIEDEDGNPVADINGNVSTVTGAASFRFYPKINGYSNRYTITEAYATKAGWIDSVDAASTFGSGGNVNVNGETLSALTYSLTSGSSYPQETELVITSPEGAMITWTYSVDGGIFPPAIDGDSPVSVVLEAAGHYAFAAKPIKDYYTSPAVENTTYDITATMVYVASYGHGPGDTPAGDGTKDNPFNSFADAINLLGTAGSATNPANTIYVLDDMTAINGLTAVSGGYYNIVGRNGGTVGSPAKLGVTGGGTVLSVNGTATVSLRAITITGDTNASSGVVSVLGGTFILKDHVNITGNTDASGNARNINLGTGQKISVDAAGLAGTKVGVSAVDVPTTGNPVVITSGYAASASAADLPYVHFASDSGYAAILSEATATLGEAAFAVGGGSIDIGEIYSVDFAVADSAGVYTVSATATPTSGSPLDITSEVTAWTLKLYYLNTYTGMTSATNTMDLSALGEGTYIMKISAVYGGKAYSGEVEIVISDGTAGMVLIPHGSFKRAAPIASAYNITLTKDFYICDHEVTQKEWEDVMGVSQSQLMSAVSGSDKGSGDDYPVYYVNWYHAIAYCNKKSLADGLTPCYSVSGVTDWAALNFASIPTSSDTDWNSATCDFNASGYRLPTEAEWEYAALGDYKDNTNWNGYRNSSDSSAIVFAGYNGINSIDDYAWYTGTATDSKTHETKGKAANSYGLYDMSGNVREWCWDWYGSYASADVSDPSGASSGSNRVIRGGSWNNVASYCSVADRYDFSPYGRYGDLGFRVVRNAP